MRSARSYDILESGQVLGGCIVESHLGSGSMGAVYRARQTELDRLVALKVLRPELVADERIHARFLREARVAASLDHPSFIHVFDVGEEDGIHYIVMEFVEGTDLRRWIQVHGPLPWRQALIITRRVAAALDYAHKKDVVHRDIKPANIILSCQGETKVADLGLARPLREDTHVTGNGELVGTPVYMSPEQCRDQAVDGRTDLYGLGSTLYTLLTGRPPFTSDNAAALIQKVLNDRPPSLKTIVPGLPDEVVGLVQRLMAKLPAARFQTGAEVVRAVDQVLSGKAATPAPPPVPRQDRVERRGSSLKWPVVAAAALLAVAFAVVLRPGKDGDASSRPAGATPARVTGTPSGGEPGSGASGDEAAQTRDSSSPGGVEDRDLARRMAGFRSDLESGDMRSVLEYFRPSQREDVRLRFSLARFIETLQSRDMRAGTYVVEKEAEDSASVMLLFRGAGTGQSLGLPLEWVRAGEDWYVNPISRYVRGED